MADILLAHSFFLKNDPKQMSKMQPYPPLGLLHAASALRNQGYSIVLFDAMLSDGVGEFESLLESQQPSFVVLYEDQFHFLNKMCLGHVREASLHMAAMARKRAIPVIAAGADVSDHPEVYLRAGVGYALLGEADHSLSELLHALSSQSGAELDDIAGLALHDPQASGSVRRTPPRLPERHPDVFPFPAWDLLDVERYRTVWRQAHGYFSLNMATTRGCPFHCNWCAKPIWGQRYGMRSPANVAEEMALLKHTLRPDHIWFADDIFGLRPAWVAEFAQELEARHAAIPFMIQSRVDLMTEQAISSLAKAGCTEVWMGAESGSQKILDGMDKGTTLTQIPVVRAQLRQAGIKASFFIQFGYPGETFEDIMATVQMVRDTLPDDIGVSVSYPLPGTKFHRMVQAQLDTKDHWDTSNDLAMMFEGTYQTAFYRKLHTLLHQDLDLRRRLQASPSGSPASPLSPLSPAVLKELDTLNRDWFELGQLEMQSRSASPTTIRKTVVPVEAPDLSKGWN